MRPDTPPPQVRVAGGLVGLEALAALVFTVVLCVEARSAALPLTSVLGEAGYFGVIAATLGGVGIGLVRGGRWARTPAIVTQLLLLPAVYSLLGPSRQLLLGIVCGAFVITTFLLLISEASRTWSMGLDLPDAPGRS